MKCPKCGAENPEDKRFCGDCGTPVPPGSVTSQREMVFPVRINVLCIIGAIVGVMAIYSSWIVGSTQFVTDSKNLSEILDIARNTEIQVACVSFMLGVFLSFITPIGSALEITGVALYIVKMEELIRIAESEYNVDYALGAGVFVGMASAVIVLVGAVKPLGLGYGHEPPGMKGRMLTVSLRLSPSRLKPLQTDQPHWVGMYCKYCGRPLAEEALRCPECGREAEEP